MSRFSVKGDPGTDDTGTARSGIKSLIQTAVLEASQDGILVEENEQIIFVNESYLKLFGFDDPGELIGHHVSRLIGAEDVDRVVGYGKARLSGAQAPSKYEFKGMRRDGSLIDVEATVSTTAAASFTLITTFIRDIGERKRLGALLEAQKQALEMVVRGAPLDRILIYLTKVVERQSSGTAVASILMLDENGCLRNGASPGLPESYLRAIDGLKAEADVGTCSSAAATGEVVITRDIAAEGKWEGIAHLPLELGFVAAWSMPIVSRGGHVLGTFGTYFRQKRGPTVIERQIVEMLARTAALAIERKEADESLRSSEHQLTLITNAIPLLVSFVDSTHRYRFVNRAYFEWFGRPREDVIGSHLSEVLGTEAYEDLLPEIDKALAGEEVTFQRSVPYRTGEKYIHVTYIPEAESASGEIIGFHAFVQDISAQKEAEEELLRSKDELETRVRERTGELEKVIAERVEILHQLVNAQEDERRRVALDLHDHLGQQMTVLRLKLAEVQKACSPGGEAHSKMVEVRAIARQLDSDIDFLARQFRPAVLDDLGLVAALGQYINQWSAHVGLAASFDAERFGSRRLDPEYETTLYRITQEALNNVYKHASASEVSVFLELKKAGTVLIVEDNGIGFEPGNEARGGKGIGLMGMRERIALIGGSLEIESTEGGGTTIYASVPAAFTGKNGDE